MRITGRQLRQIIKEEVEKMMNEEDAEIFGSRDAQGNIKEADAPAAAPVGDMLAELKTKLGTDPTFQRALKQSIFKHLDMLYARTEMMKDFKSYKVNLVGKITSGGFVAVVTDAAVDGQKVPNVNIFNNKAEMPVVAFVDLPLTVEVGSNLPERIGVKAFSCSAVTFRPLPKKV